MKSKRAKGNYYLKKSIDLLKSQGYSTTKLESNKFTVVGGHQMWIHTDAFGSDILAMNEKEILFIQVKFETDAVFSGKKKWIAEFDKHKWAPHVKRQLWLWTVRKPVIIIEC
jgi:hypothetical protein